MSRRCPRRAGVAARPLPARLFCACLRISASLPWERPLIVIDCEPELCAMFCPPSCAFPRSGGAPSAQPVPPTPLSFTVGSSP